MAPPIAPPKPIMPATDHTIVRGKKSVGRVMIRLDQACWQKNAMLNNTIAVWTGETDTSITTGMPAAQRPSASLRAKSREYPRRSSQLENQPPAKLPTPEAAYGIHA